MPLIRKGSQAIFREYEKDTQKTKPAELNDALQHNNPPDDSTREELSAKAYLIVAGSSAKEEDYFNELYYYLKVLVALEKELENPYISIAYSGIAGICIRQEDYEDALYWYNKALKIINPDDPSFFDVCFGFASSHYMLNNLKEALDWYLKTLAVKNKPEQKASIIRQIYQIVANIYDYYDEQEKACEYKEKLEHSNDEDLSF